MHFCGLLNHIDALRFWLGVSIHNATGNMSEYPLYCRISIRNIVCWVVKRGSCCINDEPMAGTCILVFRLQVLCSSAKKIYKSCVSLSRPCFPASPPLCLLLSYFFPCFLSCSLGSHNGPGTGYILS